MKEKDKLTRFEARGVLWWLIAGIESFRYGSMYKGLMRGIEKLENIAEQVIYLKMNGSIGIKKKKGTDYLDELIVESKSNPTPIRCKRIEEVWRKHWEIKDKKDVSDSIGEKEK